ncbi:MAG: hypothetical protein QOJ12_3052 [Thermoleophilales bacterium]|nr:hypothetical protein [Thermoleophilales bacterium]
MSTSRVTFAPRHGRWGLAALLAALGSAALPAAASAFDSVFPSIQSVSFSAGKAKGYDVDVEVFRTRSDPQGTVHVTLTRRVGTSVQAHRWSLGGKAFPSTLSFDGSLKSGRVRADLGRFGSLDLRLTGTGSTAKVAPEVPLRGASPNTPAADGACTGESGKRRAAKISGTVELTLDKDFFGTLRPRRVTGASLESTPSVRCPEAPAGAGTDVTLMSGGGPAHPGSLKVTQATSGATTVDYTVLQYQRTPGKSGSINSTSGALVTHQVTATGLPASTLTRAPDLSSATLTGSGAFFSGSGQFAAAGPQDFGSAMGTMSGGFTVRFDGFPDAQPFAAPAQATLTDPALRRR